LSSGWRISQSEESREEETTVTSLRKSAGLRQLIEMPHRFHYIKIVTFTTLIAINQRKPDIAKGRPIALKEPKNEKSLNEIAFVVVIAQMKDFNSLSGILTRLRVGRPRNCSIPCISKIPPPALLSD
jgi:hypothetical protein